MDISQNIDISKLIGLDSLEPDERDSFLEALGDVVFDSALLRLIGGLNSEQSLALDHYLEDEPSGDILLQHLFEHYPQFENILKEEMEAFREEVVAAMPPVTEKAE